MSESDTGSAPESAVMIQNRLCATISEGDGAHCTERMDLIRLLGSVTCESGGYNFGVIRPQLMAASEGEAEELDNNDEFECFVLRPSELQRFKQACHAIDSDDAERSRRVRSVDEWDKFIKELNAGTAHAVGYKWFPYTAGGCGMMLVN